MDTERKNYWKQQLDRAYELIMRIKEHSVADNGENLVSMVDAAREAKTEVAFSEKDHIGGLPRLFFLREGIIDGFIKSAREMNRRGWVLKVEDGFRNYAMQKFLSVKPEIFDTIMKKVLWELDGEIPSPDFMFKRIMVLAAQTPRTGTHMSGSAIDISVIDKSTGKEVDRGGPYCDMSERTPMESPFVSETARRNRMEIAEIMCKGDFVYYPYEFWHFCSGDAYDRVIRGNPSPAKYGAVDWNLDANRVIPISEQDKSLNSLAEIDVQMKASLQRIKS